MANIRVDLNKTIKDGSAIVFRSPVDCSAITGLVVYYVAEYGAITSKEFVLADAHGHNVGDIDHLFAENAVVKVILDVTAGMAYVQNADTNAYIERTFIKTVNGVQPDENGNVKIAGDGNICVIDATNGWSSIGMTYEEILAARDAGEILVMCNKGYALTLVSADKDLVFERNYIEGTKDEGFKLVTDRCEMDEDMIWTVLRARVIDLAGDITVENGQNQHIHIKYSDDGKTFSGNMVPTDISGWESGFYTGNGIAASSKYICYEELFAVTPGDEYVCGNGFADGVIRNGFSWYDADGNFLNATYNAKDTVTIPDGYHYCRFFLGASTDWTYETYQNAFASGEIVPTLYKAGTQGEEPGAYLGILVDFNEEASTVFSDYTWHKLGGGATDEQIESVVEAYMAKHPGSGGGLSITDDGDGNVSIASTGSVTITDDGNGNVTIV